MKDTLHSLDKSALQKAVRELEQRLDAAYRAKDYTSAFVLRAMNFLAKQALYERLISERKEAAERAENEQNRLKAQLDPLMEDFRRLQKQVNELQNALDNLERAKNHARSDAKLYLNAKAALEAEKPPIEGSFAVGGLVVTLDPDELVREIIALAND